MRIVFFSRCLYLSGVTTHMIDLSQALIAKGHEVFLISGGVEYKNPQNVELLNRMISFGVKYIEAPLPVNFKNKITYALMMAIFPFWLKFKIKALSPDVLHIHTAVLTFAPKLLGYKFITTTHLANLKLGFFHCSSTHEIAISQEIREEQIKKFDYDNKQISLVFNGVSTRYCEPCDEEILHSLKLKNKIPEDKIIIGFVGSIDKRKGVDILLSAISLLSSEIKQKCHVILLGNIKDEIAWNWIKCLIDQFNLNDSISLCAFQDPKPIYDLMDIFILPSRLEGFPLVIPEAMLSECCVVRSNTQGAYDQIDHGVNGYIFENENAQELSEILEPLILDEELRLKVAKAGKEKALKEFTADVMAEKTLEAYKNVLLR